MPWRRRRDLEGGTEVGVWLLLDGGTVTEELSVESHESRGGDFDVYTAALDGKWEHRGTFDPAATAFDAALAYIDASQVPLDGP